MGEVSSSIPFERMVQCCPVPLRFHERFFKETLVILARMPFSHLIEKHGISEVIQCQITYPAVIALIPIYILRIADVIVLSVMRSCK